MDKIGLVILWWIYGKKKLLNLIFENVFGKKGEYKVFLMFWCIFIDYKEF